jgi:hypothetical protein
MRAYLLYVENEFRADVFRHWISERLSVQFNYNKHIFYVLCKSDCIWGVRRRAFPSVACFNTDVTGRIPSKFGIAVCSNS